MIHLSYSYLTFYGNDLNKIFWSSKFLVIPGALSLRALSLSCLQAAGIQHSMQATSAEVNVQQQHHNTEKVAAAYKITRKNIHTCQYEFTSPYALHSCTSLLTIISVAYTNMIGSAIPSRQKRHNLTNFCVSSGLLQQQQQIKTSKFLSTYHAQYIIIVIPTQYKSSVHFFTSDKSDALIDAKIIRNAVSMHTQKPILLNILVLC